MRWFFFFFVGFLESTGGDLLEFVFRSLDRIKNWSPGESRGPERFHSRKKELGEGAESIKGTQAGVTLWCPKMLFEKRY